jgi:hypothetical protein
VKKLIGLFEKEIITKLALTKRKSYIKDGRVFIRVFTEYYATKFQRDAIGE